MMRYGVYVDGHFIRHVWAESERSALAKAAALMRGSKGLEVYQE